MKPVLVLTNKNDTHVDFVGSKIRELGGDFIRINTEDIHENSKLFFELETGNRLSNWEFEWNILDSQISFTKEDIDTVWYRKPRPVDCKGKFNEEHACLFVEEEYSYFLRSFYSMNLNKRWVNPFWSIRRASQKLPNLQLAQSLGLRIPKTIISNDPTEVERFARQCDWKLLVKTFFFSSFVFNKEDVWHCFAKQVDEKDFFQSSENINLSPGFFQEYVEKDVELRVTIIGQEIFAVSIDSQEKEKTQDDCRAGNIYDLPHEPFELPLEIKEKLLQFNNFYSLEFSTFDIILTPKGEYMFLECNPNGQWYWLEIMTKLPMAETMARFLLGK